MSWPAQYVRKSKTDVQRIILVMSFMAEIEKSLFDFKLLWQFQDLHDPIGVLNESILLIIISDGP